MMQERDDEVIVGIPFMELGLVWRSQSVEGHLLVESHFSKVLGERAVMLVVRERLNPGLKGFSGHPRVTLPFAFERAEEYIEFMWRNYHELLQKLRLAGQRRSTFRGTGASGMFRMLFGGGLHRLPEYQLGEVERLSLLISLYSCTLFPRGEKPMITAELKAVIPFAYSPTKKTFRYPLGGRSRLRYSASILTELIRRGEIPEPVKPA